MPILSVFYGLIVRMYAEGDGQHHTPHIHVVYQGEEYQFNFDGNELNGKVLTPPKKKLLDAWLVLSGGQLGAAEQRRTVLQN